MATQTMPLPQLQLAPVGQLQRPGSGLDGRDANTMLYGVNAAMASGRAANGAASCKLPEPLTCLVRWQCLLTSFWAELLWITCAHCLVASLCPQRLQTCA